MEVKKINFKFNYYDKINLHQTLNISWSWLPSPL